MKKCIVWFLVLLILSGCSDQSKELEAGLELRNKLQTASGVMFTSHITADYGDKIHSFSLECKTDSEGNIAFTVLKPTSISGISGKLFSENGEIIFSDTVLCFPLLTDGQISPVSAPWIMFHSLCSGYFASACTEDEAIRLSINDRFEEKPLRLDIWMNPQMEPERSEILYDGKKILSVAVENFLFL